MAIELITGSPGAGKTTFAVAERVAKEAGRKIPQDVGEPITRRIVVAGIRGLVVEHERIPHKLTGEVIPDAEVDEWNKLEAGDVPRHQRLPGAPPVEGVRCLVQNWWLWCKPGDLIVVDEAQFIAPRGTLGRKPPYWIQALEIHRHYGVDFLLITQHPQLIDTTIRALVGLHRHVRSVMGSAVCMVYVWDHASNPERYNLSNKTMFRRRKAHYKLFHSSVAHVKPPSSGRSIMFVVPIILALGFLAFSKFSQRFKAPEAQAAVASASNSAGASAGSMPGGVPIASGSISPVRVTGCMAVGDDCRCIGDEGRPIKVSRDLCEVSSRGYDGLVQWEPRKVPESAASAPAGPVSSGLPGL